MGIFLGRFALADVDRLGGFIPKFSFGFDPGRKLNELATLFEYLESFRFK